MFTSCINPVAQKYVALGNLARSPALVGWRRDSLAAADTGVNRFPHR